MKPTDRGAFIGVIGTDLIYRGRPLRNGEARPGNVLLEGLLEVIQNRFRGAMPFVKAALLPENTGSKQLFDAFQRHWRAWWSGWRPARSFQAAIRSVER